MKLTRQHATTIGLFLLLVILGDRVGGLVVAKLFNTSQFRFSRVYDGELAGEIVVLGNSRGIHMFHAPAMEAVTGKSVANLSFNSLPVQLLPVLWHDYVERHAAPEQLIVEVSCVGRVNEPGSLERFTVLMPHSWQARELLLETCPTTYFAAQASHLFRYNNELFFRSLLFARKSDQDWIMDSAIASDWQDSFHESLYREFVQSDDDARALKQLVTMAEADGAKVTLIFAPYLQEYLDRTIGSNQWRQWLEEKVDHPIKDYSRALTNRQFFGDPIHLNQQGAAAFAQRLVDDGDLQDASN